MPGSICINKGLVSISRKFYKKGINPFELYKKAMKGEQKAVYSFKEMGRYLGIGLAGISNIFDPDLIVIGGGLSNAGRFFIGSAKKEMRKRILANTPPKVEITRLKDSGIIGGSLLVNKL